MSLEHLLEIAKKIEGQRDSLITEAKGLTSYFISALFNTFFFVYIESLSEMAKADKSIDDSIRNQYWRSRFTSLRYLLETYLTAAHVLAKIGPERDVTVVSLALHQRTYLHKMNLYIHTAKPTEKSRLAIEDDADGYKKILQKFPTPWDTKLPTELKNLPDPNSEAWMLLGLKYYKNNKIPYTGQNGEIHTNPLVLESIKQSFQVEPLKMLESYYQILSMQGHPTLETFEDYDKFEKSTLEEKIRLIQEQNLKFNMPILKILGEAMIRLGDIALKERK